VESWYEKLYLGMKKKKGKARKEKKAGRNIGNAAARFDDDERMAALRMKYTLLGKVR
jgi:hypothetical protein